VAVHFHGSVSIQFQDHDFLSALKYGRQRWNFRLAIGLPRPGCQEAFKAVGYHARNARRCAATTGLFLRATAGS